MSESGRGPEEDEEDNVDEADVDDDEGDDGVDLDPEGDDVPDEGGYTTGATSGDDEGG